MQEELKRADDSIRADMKLLQTFIDDSADEAESKAFYNMRAWIITALHDTLRTPVSGEVAEGCKSTDMGEFACANRSQCFEPCGELGHSAEHAKPAQGIDHAKLDDQAGFEAAYAQIHGSTPGGGWNDWNAERAEYEEVDVQEGWRLWQARGQQTGGADPGIKVDVVGESLIITGSRLKPGQSYIITEMQSDTKGDEE